jgi:hypothetical protein
VVKPSRLRRDKATGLFLIDRPEDIPDFDSEEDEVAFWDTHTFSERYWSTARHIPFEQLGRSEPGPVSQDG